MPSISSRNLVDAVLRFEQMTFKDRELLADEVHAGQPNLFFSVLVLQRYGATLEQIEVVLNLLLVLHEAMKCSGASWPVISEDVQELCLARIAGGVRSIEGLTPQLQMHATLDAFGVIPKLEDCDALISTNQGTRDPHPTPRLVLAAQRTSNHQGAQSWFVARTGP